MHVRIKNAKDGAYVDTYLRQLAVVIYANFMEEKKNYFFLVVFGDCMFVFINQIFVILICCNLEIFFAEKLNKCNNSCTRGVISNLK